MLVRSTGLLLVALSLLAPRVEAQGLPFQIDLDTGSFLYGGGESLLEVYVSVGVHTLDFTQTEDGFSAEVPVIVSVAPAASAAPEGTAPESVFEQTLDLRFSVRDTLVLREGREYVEQVRATVPPGEYDVIAVVPGDTQSGRSEIELRLNDIVVPDYEAAQGAAVSSIQLASTILRAGEGSADFVKSGLEIQPNPTQVFAMNDEGVGMRAVPYYAEIYGADGEMADENYTVLAYLSQSNRPNPLPEYQQRTERPVRPVDVVVGRFDISQLPSGTYYLRIAALNAANEPVAERGQKFYVVNPTVEVEDTFAGGQDFETLLFAGMGLEEVELEIEQVSVIADSREQSMLGRAEGLEAKQIALASFWRSRDTDPNPNINSARRTFLQRMSIVQDRYREPLTEGFRTDRGRVFLEYGPPSEVDERRFEAEAIPHVIWTFDNIPGEGRSIFVFADRFTSGRLELIHSDVTGEISVPNWQDELIRIR
ncbi:MAG: GWxTD domain-containing protein [Bacteroidota bacterium]